jgi:hypothetical protein
MMSLAAQGHRLRGETELPQKLNIGIKTKDLV